MERAFASAEKVYKRTVLHNTWGHLAPKVKQVYQGFILFAHGCNGDIVVINYSFRDSNGNELDASPWLWEDINEYVGNYILPQRALKSKQHGIYEFKGTYKKSENKRKNSVLEEEGKGIFRGRVKKLRVKQ